MVPRHPILEASGGSATPAGGVLQGADSSAGGWGGGRAMREWLKGDFKLGRHEAVVVIGCTPPPARYFSITPYLHDINVP
eukprot:744889-Prorocentrum_minimum.AAC.1